ncbi:MAG: hypothetical protein P4L50_08690 [Anaerolineaceae bacterium]|nr:hypothetical protein [Anaerolineaceae bacterium]
MPLTKAILVEETLSIFETPLKALGYKYSSKYFDYKYFGFYKKSLELNLYLHIEFQAKGFGLDDLFDLAINLIRDTRLDLHTPRQPWRNNEPVARFSSRLSPKIYQPGSVGIDHWWHFVTIEEARSELNDIYDKLINYGIPYLENPNSQDVRYIRN